MKKHLLILPIILFAANLTYTKTERTGKTGVLATYKGAGKANIKIEKSTSKPDWQNFNSGDEKFLTSGAGMRSIDWIVEEKHKTIPGKTVSVNYTTHGKYKFPDKIVIYDNGKYDITHLGNGLIAGKEQTIPSQQAIRNEISSKVDPAQIAKEASKKVLTEKEATERIEKIKKESDPVILLEDLWTIKQSIKNAKAAKTREQDLAPFVKIETALIDRIKILPDKINELKYTNLKLDQHSYVQATLDEYLKTAEKLFEYIKSDKNLQDLITKIKQAIVDKKALLNAQFGKSQKPKKVN